MRRGTQELIADRKTSTLWPAGGMGRVKPNSSVSQGPHGSWRKLYPTPGRLVDAGLTRQTAVRGPARTVVWEGPASDCSPYPDFPDHTCDRIQVIASSGSGVGRALRVGTIIIAAVLVHVGVRDVRFLEAKGSDE